MYNDDWSITAFVISDYKLAGVILYGMFDTSCNISPSIGYRFGDASVAINSALYDDLTNGYWLAT